MDEREELAALRRLAELEAKAGGQQKPQISALERLGEGMADPVHGGAQLLTKMLPTGVVNAGNRLNNWLADKTGMVAKLPEGGVDQAVREREANLQTEGFDGWRALGNVISPVNVAGGRAALGATSLAGRMGMGAATSAANASLAPVGEGDFAEEKLKQMAIGGTVGGALPLAGAGFSRMISPKASTNPELALLKSEGVRPTVGQALGGAWNRAEERATSLPFVGDAISSARQRAREDFNRAALNRTGSPIGASTNKVGTEAVSDIHDAVSAAYNAAKSQLGNFKVDAAAKSEIANLERMAQQLPKAEAKAVKSAIEEVRRQLTPQGHLLADTFKTLDSKLGNDAARFSGATDAYQQKAGEALSELQRILTENAKRANPQAAKALKEADTAFANLVRVEGAANGAKATDGVFTPGQLLTAVKQADRSVRDNATARGKALMQDLAGAGQSVLGNKVPNSGTAERLFLGAGALGGAYKFIDPMAAAGMVGAAGAYLPLTQRALVNMVSSRPAYASKVAGLLEQSTPMFSPGFGLLAAQVAD